MDVDVVVKKADEEHTDSQLGDVSAWPHMNQALGTDYAQPEEVHAAGFTPNGFIINDDATSRQRRSQQRSVDRVPIPPLSSAGQPPPSGPMSSSVIVPPRPKPGRKPIPEADAQDRRRVQNRIAQRNFRDKRQQKLAETQHELEEKKMEYQDRLTHLTCTVERLKTEKRDLQRSLDLMKKRAEHAELRAQGREKTTMRPSRPSISPANAGFEAQNMGYRKQPHTSGPVHYDPTTITPPEDYTSSEIDYTNYQGTSQQFNNNNFRPSVSNDSNMDFGMEMEPGANGCGFCEGNSQVCVCVNQDTPNEAVPEGPGNCAACLQNPNRAAACKQISKKARPGFEGSARTISCSDLLDQVQPQQVLAVPKSFGDRVNGYQGANGRYQIEEQQAAQALQTLSRRNGPS